MWGIENFKMFLREVNRGLLAISVFIIYTFLETYIFPGTVVVGTLESGILKKGDKVEIKGDGKTIQSTASDMQVFNKSVKEVDLLNFRKKRDLVRI